ncbi:LlaJI family restriction endonuclease [Bacillus sp. 31A1R]|uniref:LlaJI family restriction endonuclease n=1 Tax=Robertmurraya mangrovi TaxID=3098077 RepID=A0ABU5IZ56_9BACI|nr:LlaJI family restriction endonuclease [Bacillus sp. 31A1R]MDZ5472421.1 LlaJI family restriction endonuclease [Bacillus sp. 31A1R]
MKPVYLQELKKYHPTEFKELLGLTDDEYKITIQELQAKRILKVAKDGRYVLQFVGMLLCFKKLFFCIPKYIKKSDSTETMKQLLTLFREYSKREKLDQDEMESFGGQESLSTFNLLSVIMFLLNDYLENDLYQNDKNVYILNGDNGEIDWNKTIHDQYAIINDGQPIYVDYYVNSVINDENDYFRLLHMHVLTACSRILEETELGEYLGFPPVMFDVDEGVFGSKEIVLSRIESELSVQFVNRKQMVLKAIAAFVSHDRMLETNESIEFYGTRNFEVVWEKICGFVLDNQYDNVKQYIDKPIWTPVGKDGHAAETLKPDVISMFMRNHKKYFMISDAKYYNIQLTENTLHGNPGVGDVTKQYLYQLAFKKYMELENVEVVHNVLLFPSEQESIEYLGEVSIEFLKALQLGDIMLVKLPVVRVFQMYIHYERMELGTFGMYLDGKRPVHEYVN